MYTVREEFWKKRAQCYEKLEWATKSGYLHSFLDAGDFSKHDVVLDIGTGSGIIAHTLSPQVRHTIALDISTSMLDLALKHRVRNEIFLRCDARNLPLMSGSVSRVTARMVFHHIIDGAQLAMKECFRVLSEGGRMVFSEGVPPSEHVKPFYTKMFKLKEERITFMEDDLEALMRKAGFRIAKKIIHWNKGSSIKNWLENSGLPQKTQDTIFRMHLDMDEQGKKDYNMAIRDDDCFIDMKFLIYVGEKQ
ncbi:MAG: class I SAM-dependent methyltransferase [Candidatus Omnitrophica bacterium]|nr:class I SAM-dependent methyltransferase [Candidatus Omnitrophota bacterium]